MLIRIAYPKGNSQKGKLKGSHDLKPTLKQKVKAQQSSELDDLFRGHKPKRTKAKKKKTVKRKEKQAKLKRPLYKVFPGGKVLYATYNGKDHKAWVRKNGGIKYKGVTYDTPSGAGKAARKRSTNGWIFWKYRDENGDLVKLTSLRK